MSKYKTYRKEKYLYFVFSVIAYFLPFVVVSAVFFPLMEVATGFKVAIGLAIVIINAIPFLMGAFKAFFAHFPMLNILAILFLALAAFFTMDAFKNYVDVFCWIELAAAVGSVVSCILWGQFRKYSDFNKSMRATLKSGAFVTKENKDD